MLAGAAHITVDDSIRFQQGMILQREWDQTNRGTVLWSPTALRLIRNQLKPEVARPRALLDVRMRKALAHAIDRQTLADGLFDGQGIVAQTLVVPQVEYFPDLDRAIAKYSYDPARARQLLNEVGFVRDADGYFTSATEGRFSVELRVLSGPQNETEATIMAAGLQQVGIDATIFVLSIAQGNDTQLGASFPGLNVTSQPRGFEPPIDYLRASQIPSPETRWLGNNRQGWINPEFERLLARYETSLEQADRNQAVVQMLRIVSEELPLFPLYYNFSAVALVTGLRGVSRGASIDTLAWNIHEWQIVMGARSL
jgi:peptide/nickel transport system substrate-binding protein